MSSRFITIAIHTYEKAVALRALLEREGIQVEFRNVNIEHPVVASGVRVRISESDLPLALRIIENREIFTDTLVKPGQTDTSKPILVPIDFSEESFAAAAYAFSLAARHNTQISLLHTYIDPYIAGSMQLTDSLTYELTDISAREKIERTAHTQMRHFADRLKDMIKNGKIPPAKFTTSVVEGVPEDIIADSARVNSPFMIVMATRGPRRKEIEMVGSVTAEVLDKCRIPVLVIPENGSHLSDLTDTSFKSILFFANLDQQDILALDSLYRIYPNVGNKVTIAHIPGKKRLSDASRQSLNAICDYSSQNFRGYSFVTEIIESDNIADDIRSLESGNRFDLFVVPNKKKNIFSRLFSPTLAHRVLFSSEIPMLVIPV